MGGIKNKLNNKLSNKTLFKVPLWIKGDVRRKSDRGIVSDTNPLDSRLPSFSQPSEMLTRNISNTRKSNWWSLYASKTIGSLRLVTLTKYLSIACLSLAILSTLILNIVSSYSSSKIESNAEPVTQANGPLVSGPAAISLSITPLTTPTSSLCDTSNSNICMKIPDEGGIATGGHTIKINTNSIAGWSMSLSTNNDGNLVNSENEANVIRSLPSTADIQHATTLSNNTWGIALPYGTNAQHYSPEANYLTSDKDTLASTLYSSVAYFSQSPDYLIAQRSDSTIPATETRNIYYGVRVDNPSQLLAGDYQTQVVYTATVKLPSKPTITSVSPNTYELGSGESEQATIKGANLESTYKVYIESNTDSTKQYDITNTITNLTDAGLTVTIPTDQTNPDLEPGDYTIHVVTQGGEETIGFTYTEKPKPVGTVCTNADSQSACQVDIDVNMIPIRYDGNNSDGSARWLTVSNDEVNNNKGIWYNYEAKQWANAVTVEADKLNTYQNKSGVEVNNDDVLGYWVYIPRYAYKVMRKEVTDKVVTDEEAKAMGGFSIRFETNEDFKRTPKSCSTSSSSRYYQDCVDTTYPTEERLANQTAWATHPAFSWGSKELNGFWIGKFEATGTASNPTVLPNEKHIGDTNEYTSGISNVNGEGVGIYYDIAKIVGKEDVNNSGGNGNEFAKPNQHNFQDYSSHVLKNSEWGAATYLASSVYGAGIGEVRNNGNTTDYGAPNYSSYGITGCGPEAIEDTGKSYQDFGTIGEADACGDLDHGYNGKIGVLASTTGNVYGVYDMAGGVYEFVAGVYSENNVNYSDTDLHPFFVDPISEPYADLYRARDFLAPVRDSYGNNNYCTWSTCGGDATYETKNVQSVVSVGLGEGSSWANDSSMFVQPGNTSNTMLMRGGYGDGADDGIYSAYLYPGSFGYTGASYGFRIGLHNLK